jgi:probable F420-dependent oxidoreductase
VYDAFAYLCFLAARCPTVRLGTHVYNLGLRHPFIAARAVQTLDVVSGGRVEFGIGASWLEEEWVAAQLDFKTRGRRVDESLEVCKRLWTEPAVAHDGEFFSFDAVAFEPKPVQKPYPPILVGGESPAALRRAALLADGWIGMAHTLESATEQIAKLRELRKQRDDTNAPDRELQICVGGPVRDADEVKRWEEIGVTRLVIAPWKRSPDAVDAMMRYAELVGLTPR